MDKQKLLLVINHLDWFWSHRLPLAKGAQARGMDVHVAVAGASADVRLGEQGFQGHNLPDMQGASPFLIVQTIWSVFSVLRAERPDIVHAITLKSAFITGLAARFSGVSHVVLTLAGLGYLFSSEGVKPRILRVFLRPFLCFAFRRSNVSVIFQNPDDMELMISRGFVREEQCMLIRGSGVDLNMFSFTPLPKEQDSPIVLLPTRLVHDKGIAVFIEVAQRVQCDKPHVRFQIAGGIIQSNPLAISKEEMQEMLEGSDVEWLGRVDDMVSLYSSAHLIFYPSYYGEGVPKVLLETASTGRAIVTTDHPGCREAVIDGESGFLVPVKDVEASVKTVLQLLGDPDLLEKMGKVSRKLAEEEYDVKSVVERTLKIYDKEFVS